MKSAPAYQTAFVAFGSNRGRRRLTVERALRALSRLDGVRLRRVSPLYETEAVGGPPQASFLNGVAEIETTLEPPDLLERLLAIERRLGRRRSVRWGPRTIDLDLLAVGRRRLRTRRLTLPHPRYHRRRFVLAPFTDLAPTFIHPRLGRRNSVLLRRLPSTGQRVTMVGTWTRSRYRPFSRKRKTARGS